MATTKKHDDFVSSPIGEKLVTDLPGIGDRTGRLLNDKGFTRAYKVIGQFLILDKDEQRFKDWLVTFGTDQLQIERCYNCVKTWCQNYM